MWIEIRNFKKCLIMMFAKQEKEVVFLETVMGLAQQRRHCMVECIPLPQDIAKEAPLYFKKVRCETSFYCVVNAFNLRICEMICSSMRLHIFVS